MISVLSRVLQQLEDARASVKVAIAEAYPKGTRVSFPSGRGRALGQVVAHPGRHSLNVKAVQIKHAVTGNNHWVVIEKVKKVQS